MNPKEVHDKLEALEARMRQLSSTNKQLIDALVKMRDLWYNEVYEFGYGKFKGDEVKATALADNDSYIKMARRALRDAGVES